MDISSFEPLLASFARSLRARNRSANTVRIYVGCCRLLAEHTAERSGATTWPEVTRADIESWLAARLATYTPGDARNKFGSVQQLFKWLRSEDEIATDPMAGMEPPHVPEKPVAIVKPEQIAALFKSCAGKEMVNRRDLAILRLFTATGMRLAEMAGITLEDLDLDAREVRVTGKGNRQRILKFDHGTALAIDRYLRSRAAEKWAFRPELWLSTDNHGPLKRDGIYQMFKRRAAAAGMPKLYPHMLRHTFAHRWLDADGAEGDLMQAAGWNSPQMLRRYGASARAERARSAYDRVDPMKGL